MNVKKLRDADEIKNTLVDIKIKNKGLTEEIK
jgi:hypothetical protein